MYECCLKAQPHRPETEAVANPTKAAILEAIDTQEKYYNKMFIDERVDAYNEIEEMLKSYPIVIFIRGSPNQPQCKQSKVLVEYLTKVNGFSYFADGGQVQTLRHSPRRAHQGVA